MLDVKEGDAPLSIGRVGTPGSTEIIFESKVISRAHAEIWVESGGKLFIRDTKSSTGTFINSFRLSPPSVESQPFQLRDGDVLQFGVTYQGGDKSVYKCAMVGINEEPQATMYASRPVPSSQLSRTYADIA
jgi:pSer/pThr/pTyr-binding forkhead associated (FHA) protein